MLKKNRCMLYDVTKKCFCFFRCSAHDIECSLQVVHYHYKYHNNKNESIPVLQPMSVCDRIPTHGHGKAGHGDLKTKGRGIKKRKKKCRHG